MCHTESLYSLITSALLVVCCLALLCHVASTGAAVKSYGSTLLSIASKEYKRALPMPTTNNVSKPQKALIEMRNHSYSYLFAILYYSDQILTVAAIIELLALVNDPSNECSNQTNVVLILVFKVIFWLHCKLFLGILLLRRTGLRNYLIKQWFDLTVMDALRINYQLKGTNSLNLPQIWIQTVSSLIHSIPQCLLSILITIELDLFDAKTNISATSRVIIPLSALASFLCVVSIAWMKYIEFRTQHKKIFENTEAKSGSGLQCCLLKKLSPRVEKSLDAFLFGLFSLIDIATNLLMLAITCYVFGWIFFICFMILQLMLFGFVSTRCKELSNCS